MPLPLGGGDRLVRVMQTTGVSTGGLDAADIALMRSAITTLTEVGAFTRRDFVVGDGGSRRVLSATIAEWNIFEATRTPPALGRGFRQDDQARGAEPVVVLGQRAWEVMFGSDSSIVGKRIPMSGTQTLVIGVMPAGYGFPVAAEAWVISSSTFGSAMPDCRPSLAYLKNMENTGSPRLLSCWTASICGGRPSLNGLL